MRAANRRSQSPVALEHLAQCHDTVGNHARACELRARAKALRYLTEQTRLALPGVRS